MVRALSPQSAAQKRQEVERRQSKLAKLVLDGKHELKELAELVAGEAGPVTVKTISLDLKAIREQWKQSRTRDFDIDFGRELDRLERQYRRWLTAWRKSVKPKRKRVRKYEQAIVADAIPAVPAVVTAEGVVVREAVPAVPAQFERVLVEETTTVEESTGDARYAALVEKCAENIRELLGLVEKGKDALNSSPPVVAFNIIAPQPIAVGDGQPFPETVINHEVPDAEDVQPADPASPVGS